MSDRHAITWREIGPCPCGLRPPPRIDSVEGWTAWWDHLSEAHSERPTTRESR